MRRFLWKNCLPKTLSLCYLVLVCLVSLVLSVGFSRNVSASSVSGDFVAWTGTRSYYSYSTGQWTNNATFSGTTGSILLGTGYGLSGFSIVQHGISGFSSTDTPPLYLSMVLNINQSGGQAGAPSNNPWWRLNANSSPADIPVACTVIDNFNVSHTYTASIEYQGGIDSGWQVSWRCRISTSDFSQVKSAGFYLGHLSDQRIRAMGTPNDIILVGASYHFATNNDASSDILNSQLEVQRQIRDGVGQTTDAINNLNITIQNQSQNDRESLNNEAEGYQQDLEDNLDQQAIDTKMSSIMAIIEDFVFAIGRPVISTCILPMDLRNYTGASFYELDLCHLSPPSGITTVLNVVFIFFVLGLAYSAIRSVISMYKEVIDG